MIPKFQRLVKEIGSRISKKRAREGGASVFTSFILSFLYSVPPSARKKFWPSNQAGEKEGGWGEGIFARLFCAVGAVGWEAFPPFGIKPNIKAKQFSIPFKRKRVARKNKELKRKLFCFVRRVSTGGNAGAGFQIIRAIVARKRFELRSAIATNSDILKIRTSLIARSTRRSLSRTAMRERVSLRKKPCISELNRKVGQIQIQFFGKANGGSELRSNSQMKFVSNFFHSARGGIQSKFFNPALLAKGDIIN